MKIGTKLIAAPLLTAAVVLAVAAVVVLLHSPSAPISPAERSIGG